MPELYRFLISASKSRAMLFWQVPPPPTPRVLLRPCYVTTCTSGMASELHPVHWLRNAYVDKYKTDQCKWRTCNTCTVCIYINIDFGYMDPFDLAVFKIIIWICITYWYIKDVHANLFNTFSEPVFSLMFFILMNFLYHGLHNYIYLYYTLQSFDRTCTFM